MFGAKRRQRARRVAVLGAGPAGLLSAQAAHENGYDPVIFSRPSLIDRSRAMKSPLHGCQYLHEPVPSLGLAGQGFPVSYKLEGSVDGYREKVYGTTWQGQVSPDEYGSEENHLAWDLRKVYDRLWDQWGDKVVSRHFTANDFRYLRVEEWGRIIVTVPAPTLCYDSAHTFAAQTIWAVGQRSDVAVWDFPFYCSDFTVQCNGDKDTGWYRMANVFGRTTVEWATDRRPPFAGVVRVEKPLMTDCDCHLEDTRVMRVGRYGMWRKGVLVHTAYTETKAALR